MCCCPPSTTGARRTGWGVEGTVHSKYLTADRAHYGVKETAHDARRMHKLHWGLATAENPPEHSNLSYSEQMSPTTAQGPCSGVCGGPRRSWALRYDARVNTTLQTSGIDAGGDAQQSAKQGQRLHYDTRHTGMHLHTTHTTHTAAYVQQGPSCGARLHASCSRGAARWGVRAGALTASSCPHGAAERALGTRAAGNLQGPPSGRVGPSRALHQHSE
jgi:hypothetical protein